jgi:neurofibromin 1
MLITFVTAVLNNASSDIERIILYRFLAEAAVEIPEVVSIA